MARSSKNRFDDMEQKYYLKSSFYANTFTNGYRIYIYMSEGEDKIDELTDIKNNINRCNRKS